MPEAPEVGVVFVDENLCKTVSMVSIDEIMAQQKKTIGKGASKSNFPECMFNKFRILIGMN